MYYFVCLKINLQLYDGRDQKMVIKGLLEALRTFIFIFIFFDFNVYMQPFG